MDVYTVYEEFSFWSNCVGLPKPLKEFFQFDQIPWKRVPWTGEKEMDTPTEGNGPYGSSGVRTGHWWPETFS